MHLLSSFGHLFPGHGIIQHHIRGQRLWNSSDLIAPVLVCEVVLEYLPHLLVERNFFPLLKGLFYSPSLEDK